MNPKRLITKGNLKLPKSSLIFNICPASTCPSRALGMCQLDKCGIGSGKCYAMKAEKQYRLALLHRMEQQEYWDSTNVSDFANAVREKIYSSRTPITALRLNESGDFRHAEDVRRVCSLAAWVPGLKFYFYTARRDLWEPTLKAGRTASNITVNGSGWMAHNNFVVLAGSQAQMKVDYKCPGDCRTCSICQHRGGLTIGIDPH